MLYKEVVFVNLYLRISNPDKPDPDPYPTRPEETRVGSGLDCRL